ncbi:condensation domain-containing protein, partial [Streptomyces ziwulingensis]|uniref:condensation domain-containing protein n=1 Tax=Streptomyces ziwulingensis TaxID=1045501 RepID=UPI0031EF6754
MSTPSDDSAASVKARFAAAHRAVTGPAPDPAPRPAPGPAPLSAAQRRIWFLTRLHPQSPAYHVPLVLRLTGALDEPALLAAVRDLAERHETLRGVIDPDGAEPLVRPGPAGHVPVTVTEVTGDDLDAALAAETGRPFDLTARPPMRATLFRLPGSWVLAVTVHHIATDGWSQRLLLADLARCYAARTGAGEPPPPAPRYPDTVPGDADDPAGLDWWTRRLAGLPPVLGLPTDLPRTPDGDWAGAAAEVVVDTETAARLRALAAGAGASVFMVLLAAWQSLLGRLAETDDVAVGVPHAGRHTAASEKAVGCFLDTVVIRTDLGGEPTGRDLLARARAGTLDALAHARTPFDHIVRRLCPERSLTATPLFQTLLNVYDAPEPPALPGVCAETLYVPPRTAKFDLALELADDGPGAGLHGWLEYRRDLFTPRTARRLVRWLGILLEAMAADPDRPVAGIPLEPGTGPALAGPDAGPALPPVHTLIEAQADARPDAVAVVGPDGSLTYRELDVRANRLAHRLLARGAGRDRPVGLLLEPGTRFATALLAVLKAGGAYLPLDTAYPAGRVY